MVLLTITSTTKDALKILRSHSRERFLEISNDGEPPLDCPTINHPISHDQLISLHESLKQIRQGRDGDNNYTLSSLLKGSKIWAPPPAAKSPKSESYITLMKQLRDEADMKAYSQMINSPTLHKMSSNASNVHTSTLGDNHLEEDEVTFSDVNRQLTLIINVLISILSCSVVLWLVAWHWSTVNRLLLSMTGSVVVAVAEVGIYMGYIRRVGDAKKKEKGKMEEKVVVDTWTSEVLTAEPELKEGSKMVAKGMIGLDSGQPRRRIQKPPDRPLEVEI